MAGMGAPQTDGLCLKYPSDLGLHPSVNLEMALTMLNRALQLSNTTPFHWGYIDKPKGPPLVLPPYLALMHSRRTSLSHFPSQPNPIPERRNTLPRGRNKVCDACPQWTGAHNLA